MQTVTVYRVDSVSKSKIPVGTVEERRKTDRPENLTGLLKIARKAYSSTPQEAFQIALDENYLSDHRHR
jgi:hypothetical protein